MQHQTVQARQSVLRNIDQACRRAKRPRNSVALVTVSKTQDATAIRPLLLAGQRIFGENRVQEAQQKWPALKAEFPDIELHLIGPLQSNKTAEAVALFDVIQSVDREKLVAALSREMLIQNKRLKLLVQVNTGLEPQKAGLAAAALPTFLENARTQYGISFSGLMCIPPVLDDPAPHFHELAELAKRHQLTELSMGMSSDYGVAITEGANYVRVGSAIFGARTAGHPEVAKSPAS